MQERPTSEATGKPSGKTSGRTSGETRGRYTGLVAIRIALLTAILPLGITSLGLGGCLKNVPQNKDSGKDYRYKGAKKIEFDGDEVRVKDIVTYPGGDRVDWKQFEIPEGKQGDLRVRLSWRPARPGMDLSFVVYDQYFQRLEQAKPSKSAKRSKSVKVQGVKTGKYYIQVYASRRMDAGRYTLRIRLRERKAAKVPTLEELAGQIPDPPTLPAVIEPVVKTPEELAAEQAEKDRLAAEAALRKEQDDAENARLDGLRKPIYGRIRRTQEASSGGVIITINKGREKGVDKTWSGTLLRGKSGRTPLPDGNFKIIRVTARQSVAKVRLSMDQVKANPRVQLTRTNVE